MKFLINASNLHKNGGGGQVALSICRELYKFSSHSFVVILSSDLYLLKELIKHNTNITIIEYSIHNGYLNAFLGRDQFLDNIVKMHKIDAVLTIFGPSRWKPKCPHLCGFARAQIVLTDSPYYKSIGWKTKVLFYIWKILFKKSSDVFYTENNYISERLPNSIGKKIQVFTVSNYYNQIFDNRIDWKEKKLPDFNGTTILTVSNAHQHKNLPIAIDITRHLINSRPEFNFRFVYTIDRNEFPQMKSNEESHFVFLGSVDINECPSLYNQSDIMFQPSLMECFTATYPEAMRMEVPIVTTDLEFAHGLCGDAACYFSAVDAENAAEAIYKVATNHEFATHLVANGKKQLNKYDNYEQRADKLIAILEKISK